MTERECFLAALKETPFDDTLRGAYSDWLMEHDLLEESDRQRAWRQSYDWMTAFAPILGPKVATWDDEYREMIGDDFMIDELLQIGRDYIESDELFCQYGAQTAEDRFMQNREAFWLHWSILTGLPGPVEDPQYPGSIFTCSC